MGAEQAGQPSVIAPYQEVTGHMLGHRRTVGLDHNTTLLSWNIIIISVSPHLTPKCLNVSVIDMYGHELSMMQYLCTRVGSD